MPAGLQHFTDSYMGKDAQFHLLVAPASGGTLDLEYKDDAWVTLSAGTYKLPDNQKLGVTVNVYATGAVTIQTQAAATVATMSSGDVASFVATTSTTWSPASGTTSGASLEDIYASLTGTGRIGIPVATWTEEDGTPLGQVATHSGFAQLSNRQVIQMPASTTIVAFATQVILPAEADLTAAMTLGILAATDGSTDSPTMDVEVRASAVGSGSSTDLYAGSASAITQDAGADLALKSFALTAAGAGNSFLDIVMTMASIGANDKVNIGQGYIDYTKKLLTS